MRIYFLLSVVLILGLSACQNAQNKNPSGDSENTPIADTLPNVNPMQRDSISATLQKDPNNYEALLARAERYVRQKNFAKADMDLRRAKQIDSTRLDYLQVSAQRYMEQNRSREARNQWVQCIKYYPKNIPCRVELGKLYTSLNDFKGALKYLNEAIELDPYNAEALFYKGIVIRNRNKDTTLALTYFQKAIELEPDYTEALDMLATTLVQIGDTMAPYYLKRLARQQPNTSNVYYKMGVYYMNAGELNRAIESYTKATQLNPNDAESYYNLGYIFIELKEYQDARDYFSRSIKARRENNYKSFYGRGYAHEVLGDIINAKKDYRTCLEQLPMYKPAMEGLNRINR